MPFHHFLLWLALWVRDARRRQEGLLLLTTHRAKGLEFDHVVVLDGGWKAGRNEDDDAPRRLYYVAMTRARETLTLARMTRAHPFVEALNSQPSVLARDRTELPAPAPELARRYEHLSLRDVDIGFAGRQRESARVHRAIAKLRAGDALTPKLSDDKRELLNADGVCVGRLARAFKAPDGMRCMSATVAAIVVRTRAQSDEEYAAALKCERWEVVVPELVFG